MITIHRYKESFKTAWDQYVSGHPDATIFHSISWKTVIESSFGHKSQYLLATEDKNPQPDNSRKSPRIVGILPLIRMKSFFFGNYLSSLPFAEIGGVLADDEKTAEFLLEHAIGLSERDGYDYLELRNRKAVSTLPSKRLYYNFRREILPSTDQNLKLIPRKARRMIRQGGKFGLYSAFGNQFLNDFYGILSKNFHRLGTPIFPLKLFKNFLEIFNDCVKILVVKNKEEIPIAGVFTFFFKDQVLPYYAGSLFEYRKLAPNDFMYWELMRYGCENGYKIFDFGRSKEDTGSFHFKRHWGFEPQPLAYQYHLIRLKQLPDLSPSNPKYRKKIDLWQKMPLTVTKLVGPHISRYFG
jgi:FemAB-related protein (PEP-CTERM system-associated)